MDKLPLVSVCICTYNRGDKISTTINCLLNQTYKNIELIIIDDGSTDNTENIINSFNNDKIKYIKSNHDFIKSRNLAYNSATGKYIMNMDSDDTCDINKIEKQVIFLENNKDYKICSTDVDLFFKFNKDINYQDTINLLSNPCGKRDNFFIYPNISLIHCFGTIMFKRSCLKYFKNKTYFYPEFKEGGEDQVFLYNLLALGFKFYRLNDVKYNYIKNDESITNENKNKKILFDDVSNDLMKLETKVLNCNKYYYKYNS